MSAQTTAAESSAATARLFVWVWLWLAAITGLEVFLGYEHIQPASLMLGLLLTLSVVKAGLIMSYFMHLRFERIGVVFLLVPALVFCMVMMTIFFPDSVRLLHMRP
jgi:cytochrome c oxidase subunit IV